MPDIGAKTPDRNPHFLVFEFSRHTRKLEQVQCLLEGNRIEALISSETCELRLVVLIVPFPELRHRSETADPHIQVPARNRIYAKKTLTRRHPPLPARLFHLLFQRLLHG